MDALEPVQPLMLQHRVFNKAQSKNSVRESLWALFITSTIYQKGWMFFWQGRITNRKLDCTEAWTEGSSSSSVSQARIIRCGCSRLARNLSRNREASSSSTRRPSLDRVTVISCWVRRVWSSSHSRSSDLEVPTARMHDWGGLITALKPLIPNIPRLDMLPPGPARVWGRGENALAVISQAQQRKKA